MSKDTPIYQLVQTDSCDDITADMQYKTVYSILALHPQGDSFECEFIYDITRIMSRAEEILTLLRHHTPPKGYAAEFISKVL